MWDQKHETIDRDELRAVQLARLRQTVTTVYERVPHYRKALQARGAEPGDVSSLDDVVEIHSSSGTTGKPVVVGYTKAGLEVWSELVARFATAAGVTAGDVAQIAFGYGMFTGGFGLHYGLQKLGATVVPHSAGNTARQIQFMQDFGATVLVATPSYALYIGEVAAREADPERMKLRIGLFGAEACSESMRRRIEARLGISATDNYGLTEVIGPGVSGECHCKAGMHVAEDHFIVECLDPTTDAPVPEGEVGELVFTSLTKQASPVLRYRTRDLSTLTSERCECGRTLARMGKVVGRTDDMFIISGVNVFPSTIESVLFEIDGLEPYYEVVLERGGALDGFTVEVEVTEEIFNGWMDDLVAFERQVTERLRSSLLVRPKVKLVEPGSLPRFEGKAKRVIDERPKE